MNQSLALLFALALSLVALATTRADSPAPTTQPISTCVHYKDQCVVVSSAAGVAIFRFHDGAFDGVKYDYRLHPKTGDDEIGDDEIFENYEHVQQPDGNSTIVDHGSSLELKAGDVTLHWSTCDSNSGWLYYRPENVTVQFANVRDYEKIDLKRFER